MKTKIIEALLQHNLEITHGEVVDGDIEKLAKELLELFEREVESKMRLTKDGTNSPDDVVMTYRDWLELKQRIKGE